MKTEDLFKYGVTPKDGRYAGERFIVTAITPTVVKATLYNGDKAMDEEFTHGSYEIWHDPKTLFEDATIPPTWGNLKKAMEKAGFNDDMRFVIDGTTSFFQHPVRSARFKVKDLYSYPPTEENKKGTVILVE